MFDESGYYVMPGNGLRVQGWNATADGTINTNGTATDVNVEVGKTMEATATTSIKYSGNFNKESLLIDKISYERSLKVAEEKNFIVENIGLGSYKHDGHYNLKGHSGNKLVENGSETVPVTTIDAYAREKNLPSVDFIKLDVEGAELDILKGAKTSIARYKPILAISAYHKWDDFWTLMNFIKSIRSDYEFAMRQSYETPEEEPARFDDVQLKYFLSLGLEPALRYWNECVLFAR